MDMLGIIHRIGGGLVFECERALIVETVTQVQLVQQLMGEDLLLFILGRFHGFRKQHNDRRVG